MINRRVTRTVLNSDEQTKATNSILSDALAFVIDEDDAFYIGFHGKFASRYFMMGVVNTNTVGVTLDYWNGTTWASAEDLVDETNGFKNSGFIHWQNVNDWVKHALAPITDVQLYWIRIQVTAELSVGTTLQAVLPLLCDNNGLRSEYPELVYDTRWIPNGQTNFVPQYLVAKDLVTLRLKQRGIIQDESQLIDINGVERAAIHATAMTIYRPLATDDETKEKFKNAEAAFAEEINRLQKAVDANKDGVVSDAERTDVTAIPLYRR